MRTHETLLNRLLRTLVDEWGREKVAAALAEAVSLEGTPAESRLIARRHVSGKGIRPNATSLVERAMLEGEQKEALLQLARRYENKQFLPSVADVREFLIMMGENPTDMKDRKEAFRILLQNLMKLSVDRLHQLATTALHSGPSQLGPLSDAIAAAGERLPRPQQSNSDLPTG